MAMRALCDTLAEFYPGGVPMIFGCMADKNYEAMLARLRPVVRTMIFTKVEGGRAKDPAELQALWPDSYVAASPKEAIELARLHASPDETVIVCGSLYLIGDVRSVLESEGHGGVS